MALGDKCAPRVDIKHIFNEYKRCFVIRWRQGMCCLRKMHTNLKTHTSWISSDSCIAVKNVRIKWGSIELVCQLIPTVTTSGQLSRFCRILACLPQVLRKRESTLSSRTWRFTQSRERDEPFGWGMWAEACWTYSHIWACCQRLSCVPWLESQSMYLHWYSR